MRCAVARRAGEIEIGRDLNWSSCWSVSPPSWDSGVTATLFVRWRGCKTVNFSNQNFTSKSISFLFFGLRRRSKNLFLHRGTRGDNNYQTFLAKRPVTNIAIPGTLPATFSGGRLWPEARTAVRRSRGSSDDGGWVPWFPGGRREINHSSSRFRREAVTPPPLVKIHDSGTPNRQGGYPPRGVRKPRNLVNFPKTPKNDQNPSNPGGSKNSLFR